MPTASLMTFAIGARQLVVHEAFEMMWCESGVVVGVEVDAERDRHVGLGRRRRDDHLLRARVEVLLRVVALGEEAGRLDHDVHADVAPRQVGRVALLEDLDLLAVDGDRAATLGDLAGEPAQDRVVLQEVGERRVVGDVVDRDDVDVRVRLVRRPEEVAPDPPEAVDADLDCHVVSIPPGWIR